MRRILGRVLFALTLAGVVVLGALASGFSCSSPIEARATDTGFPSRYNYFEKFKYRNGIFILREENADYGKSDVFTGDVLVLREDSHMYRDNADGTRTEFFKFEYEPVIYESGMWETTNLLTVDPFEKTVGWTLPKRTAAGTYGVRVKAYEPELDELGNEVFLPLLDEDGEVVLDNNGSPMKGEMKFVPALDFGPDEAMAQVEAVYVILYAEELDYINITDGAGNAFYRAYESGVGKQVMLNVSINGGAVIRNGLTEQPYNGHTMGNLTLDASVMLISANVTVTLEDLYGNAVPPEHISHDVSGSIISLNLGANLPRGKYVVRVIDSRSLNIYGMFIVDNAGADTFGGSISGAFFVVFGLILLAGAIVMFVLPHAAKIAFERKYKNIEKRLENVEGGRVSKAQRAMDAYEEAKEKREEAAAEIEAGGGSKMTKGQGFLSKLMEGRTKRELAREHGMTMEEFKELEAKSDKAAEAQRSSMKEFRKIADSDSLDDFMSDGFDSGEEELAETNGEADDEEVLIEAVDPDKTPSTENLEFDMLDSLDDGEMDPELKEQIFGKHKKN